MNPASFPPSPPVSGRSRARALPVGRGRTLAVLALALVSLGASGCDDRRETISRERFIATMTELRSEAARMPLGGLSEEEVDEILARHDVTEDELRRYVEVHGRNVPMMTAVWAEVDRRVRAELADARPPTDTLDGTPDDTPLPP